MKSRKQIENELHSYFINKHKNAVSDADSFTLRLRKNPHFNDNYIKLNELNYLIAKKKYDKIDCSQEEKQYKKLIKEQEALLKSMGLSKEDLSPKYSCETCQDTGIVGTRHCSCYKKALSKLLLKESGLDYSLLKKMNEFDPTFCAKDDAEHKNCLIKLKEFIEKYVDSFPKVNKDNVLIYGQTGVGKSFATECIASELIKRSFYVNIITAFQMNNIFLDYHKDFDKSHSNVLSPLLDVELLIIDDLGTEPIFKNVTNEYLLLVISERMLKRKKTIITTNLSPNDIMNRYGERIYSRIFDKAKTTAIQIVGKDLRLNNKNNS